MTRRINNAVRWLPALAVASALLPIRAQGQNWTQFGAADLPARVRTIAFSTATLTHGSSITIGRWTFALASTSIARRLPCHAGGRNEFCDWVISGFVATNAVSGSESVDLLMRRNMTERRNFCMFLRGPGVPLPEVHGGTEGIGAEVGGEMRAILLRPECPTAVELE